MLSVFLFLVVVAALGLAGVAAWRRAPDSVRGELHRLVLEFRIRTGTYDLKCVVEWMRVEMLGSALPSVTRSYVPNEMWLGLDPRDFRRWGGYADGLAHELHELRSREVAARSLAAGGSGSPAALVGGS